MQLENRSVEAKETLRGLLEEPHPAIRKAAITISGRHLIVGRGLRRCH
jgi:hypothetical protein